MTEDIHLNFYTKEQVEELLAQAVSDAIANTMSGYFAGGEIGQMLIKNSNDDYDFIWVDPAVGGFVNEVRHDNTGTYDYIGTAPVETAEDAEEWTITRTTMASPPVTTTAFGKWTDRAILVYS